VALTLACLNGLLYLFIVPPWQHYDEPGHFEYAWLIANRPSLPQPGDVDLTMRRDVAASMIEHGFYHGSGQPPSLLQNKPVDIGIAQIDGSFIYYWLAAIPLRLLNGVDSTLQMYAARAVSWLLFLVSIVGCWGVVQELTHPENVLCWLIPICLALLPAFADIMTAINNDTAAVAFATLLIWGIVRLIQHGFSISRLVWCVAWAVICLWTKSTTYPVVAALALALPLALLKQRARVIGWAGLGLLITTSMALATQWDGARSWFNLGTQDTGLRRATALAHSGQYAFALNLQPNTNTAYKQVFSDEIAQSLKGETVTVSAWVWTDAPAPQPANTPALLVENGSPGIVYQNITVTNVPQFFSFTATLPAQSGRMWLMLQSLNTATPQSIAQTVSSSIFYDDIVLTTGALDMNVVQNPSAEFGTARLRSNWQDRIIAITGIDLNYLLRMLLDPTSTKQYLAAAVNLLSETFWARFGWGHVTILYKAIYPLLNLIFAAGLLSSLYVGIAKRTRKQPIRANTHILITLSLLSIICWLAALLRGTPSLFGAWWLPSARYAYPAVVPTLLAVIGGWITLLNSSTTSDVRNRVAGAIAGAFVALNALSLLSIAQFYA
jgi:Predicted membrane protein (DUF2142)